MARVWDLAGKGRNQFVDMIDGLTEEQMNAETLCDQWTPRLILGHLVSFVEVPLPSFFVNIAKHRFDFDKASQASALKMTERSDDELKAALRENATKPAPIPMFPEGITVADTAVHTQDVRRPLGLEGQLDEDTLRAALAFVTEDKQGKLISGRDLKDMRFKASDLDWAFGEGALVEGPAEAMLMAMCGRPTYDELSGDGVNLLR